MGRSSGLTPRSAPAQSSPLSSQFPKAAKRFRFSNNVRVERQLPEFAPVSDRPTFRFTGLAGPLVQVREAAGQRGASARSGTWHEALRALGDFVRNSGGLAVNPR